MSYIQHTCMRGSNQETAQADQASHAANAMERLESSSLINQEPCGARAIMDGPDTTMRNLVRVEESRMLDSGKPSAQQPNPLRNDHEYSMRHPSRNSIKIPCGGGRRSFGGSLQLFTLLLACLCALPTYAVFIDFTNCLSPSVQNETPYQLQFVPKFVDATFNTTDPGHALKVTVWGNVTGALPVTTLPAADDTDYWRSNATANNNGKIVDIPFPDSANKFTTLFTKVNVLNYEPWRRSTDFCGHVVNATCPVIPSFTANGSNAYELPSFGFTNNFYSSYAFTTFTTTFRIANGDEEATTIGCILANITPDLGHSIGGVLRFLPLLVLIFVGFATAFAGIYSPWGTTDIFRWTTNYGRDADLLRLVTPGFGDCLHYIQFIALTGGLTLNYPGFYQPVVSKVSWSALMFNKSLVTRGNGSNTLIDGIYVYRGRYGLDKLRQLVGMQEVEDLWASMMVWLLSIIAVTLLLIQFGFLFRWIYRKVNHTQEEDLRAKNVPFSMGNVIRIVFNYFLLPIVALSMYQLVEAGHSPLYAVIIAAITLVIIIGFTMWLLILIARTKPKAVLFDDLPTLLLYGSLYNTYSDNAAPFALIPVFLTFVRGIAIGAVQASGIAQLVLLGICEVITVLTLHAFRPFHSPTSMNAFHTFFAVFRFGSILLMISFAGSLGVTDGPKGWIGYAILLMHAIVLIFGFLLNAIQTIVEVAARLAGAGGDETGAARGGLVKVFGMRQLSRRLPRREAAISRQSQLSSAAMLAPDSDQKSYTLESPRPGSTNLLNRQSTGLESLLGDGPGIARNQSGGLTSSCTPTTPGGEASPYSFLAGSATPPAGTGILPVDAIDPWYRPPRARMEGSPGDRRGSSRSVEWSNRRFSQPEGIAPDNVDFHEGPSHLRRASPSPHARGDSSSAENRRPKADYATREVDFYYGVRGPALNSREPSRRIKTGPSDPTGLPASTIRWIKGLLENKTKVKGKGFEVVRSARMPPVMKATPPEPPDGVPVATGGIRNGPIDSDSDDDAHHAKRPRPPKIKTLNGNGVRKGRGLVSPTGSDDGTGTYVPKEEYGSFGKLGLIRTSEVPPSGSDIELPSRSPTRDDGRHPRHLTQGTQDPMSNVPLLSVRRPSLPRKSSRRKSMSVDLGVPGTSAQHSAQRPVDSSSRLPFNQSTSSQSSSINDEVTLDADVKDDRRTSVGFVHNIRTVTQFEHPVFLHSTAEVIDDSRSGKSGRSGRSGERSF